MLLDAHTASQVPHPHLCQWHFNFSLIPFSLDCVYRRRGPARGLVRMGVSAWGLAIQETDGPLEAARGQVSWAVAWLSVNPSRKDRVWLEKRPLAPAVKNPPAMQENQDTRV